MASHDEECTIRVGNVPESVEVISLFESLIGRIHSCTKYVGKDQRPWLELRFGSRDNAKKALCMSGYTINGNPLVVTSCSRTAFDRLSCAELGSQDKRRNLYVLGLPPDLTKQEFSSLFGHYGTVSHCVILVMPDNAARRRGFVVMSTNAQASDAMRSLSGTTFKGQRLNVSWAVVQRSQGFLDGGDRVSPPHKHIRSQAPSTDKIAMLGSEYYEVKSQGQYLHADTMLYSSDVPTTVFSITPPVVMTPSSISPSSRLRATNLSPLLFTHAADLHALLRPFGPIINLAFGVDRQEMASKRDCSSSLPQQSTLQSRLRLLESSSHMLANSAIFEYVNLSDAIEAKAALHGQVFAGLALYLDFLNDFYLPNTYNSMRQPKSSFPSRLPCTSPYTANQTQAYPLLEYAHPFLPRSTM